MGRLGVLCGMKSAWDILCPGEVRGGFTILSLFKFRLEEQERPQGLLRVLS